MLRPISSGLTALRTALCRPGTALQRLSQRALTLKPQLPMQLDPTPKQAFARILRKDIGVGARAMQEPARYVDFLMGGSRDNAPGVVQLVTPKTLDGIALVGGTLAAGLGLLFGFISAPVRPQDCSVVQWSRDWSAACGSTVNNAVCAAKPAAAFYVDQLCLGLGGCAKGLLAMAGMLLGAAVGLLHGSFVALTTAESPDAKLSRLRSRDSELTAALGKVLQEQDEANLAGAKPRRIRALQSKETNLLEKKAAVQGALNALVGPGAPQGFYGVPPAAGMGVEMDMLPLV
jgi:hypothetical protein